jgi:hypothetical protein
MDALGDPGRSRGNQPTYAVCTVWVPYTEQEMESLIADVRRDLGLRADFEFHGRQLTNVHRDLPERFFQALVQRQVILECWCAEMRKSRSQLPLRIAGKALTAELMAQTLARMPEHRVAQVPLMIDEEGSGKKVPKAIEDMRSGLKRILAEHEMDYTLGKISARPAHRHAGLQLADFLVGALVTPWPPCERIILHDSGWPIAHWPT